MFLGTWVAKTAGTGDAGYGPDDINRFLAFIISVIYDGADGVIVLLEKMGDNSFDSDLIRENFDNVATVINCYWYDDNIDNDGDGRVDEEQINGDDDDHDGLTDEDSNYHTLDPTPNDNTAYVHVYNNWKLRLQELNSR
jgi:hypothetical protein